MFSFSNEATASIWPRLFPQKNTFFHFKLPNCYLPNFTDKSKPYLYVVLFGSIFRASQNEPADSQ